MSVLEIDVRKTLRDFRLDVRFEAGPEIVVLFGPSGAGKSLTLAAIAGIVRPDAGRIAVEGDVLYEAGAIDLPPQQRGVGYVPQHAALFPHLSVAANIGFGVRGPADERAARVDQLIEQLGLAGLERHRPAELSGGQRQRVALARALAIRPRLLALDEPFAALDTGLRWALREELLALHREWGGPLLLVTHDPDEAYTLASRMVVLDAGRVQQQGSRDDVFERPATRRVAQLVGVRNILRARVVASEGGAAVLDWDGRRLIVERAALRAGVVVDVCLRAERVLIVREDRPAPEENTFRGVIVEERPRAESRTLRVRLDGSAQPWDVEIDVPSYVYYRLGLAASKEIALTMKRADLHVIEGPPGG